MEAALTTRELRFQSGGTLRPDAFYAQRPADAELLSALRAGEFCYVLAPRQIGKSSLRQRTEQRLREQGVQCATIDLTRIGSRHVTVDEWYHSLADEIAERLSLSAALEAFWQRSQHGSPVHRFARFLRDVVLAETQTPVVLFIDEIDAVLGLSFSMDDFFGVIRSCYNDRADNPQFARLAFCLLGAAAATDLIQNPARTPFNVGRSIRLDDLTEAEAAVLLPGLQRLVGAESQSLLREVLRWTSGHPYMTQRVCEELTRRTDLGDSTTAEQVARVVQEVFLLRGRVEEQNLAYAEKRLRSEPADRTRRLLQQYRRLLGGETVLAEGEEPMQTTLRLCGLAADRQQQGQLVLQVRNLIFATVFNRAWADATQAALAPTFQAGGGLRPGALYVERHTDQILAEGFAAGEFCAVLGPRLAGKTSLMYRSLIRLSEQGLRCAYVNLVEVGLESAGQKWSRLLVSQIARSLFPDQTSTDILDRLGAASPVATWLSFFEDEVLPLVQSQVVLFLDEIDIALRFPFDVEFFSALSELHRRRDTEPAWRRISLCVAGILDEELLLRRSAAELLALCIRVPLEDFSWKEVQAFVPSLRELGDDPHPLLDAVYAWTGGQPYQTQRICMALLEQGPAHGAHPSDRVDKVVEELFLGRGRSDDTSLRIATRLVEQHPRCDAALTLYRRVLTGERVLADERDPLHGVLLRAGLITCRPCKAGAILARHNRVYATALNENWSPEATADSAAGPVRIAVGQVVAGYRLQRLLREGDLGPAFEATSEKTGARVAVHFLRQPDANSLLRAELRAISRLQHPGLLETVEVSPLDQRTLLLVRPYLDGITLEAHLAQGGLRSAGEVLMIGAQLADVLASVHSQQFRHRNVKPSKVMLLAAPAGQTKVKLMGLGLLRQRDRVVAEPREVASTQNLTFQFTPQYMAPEQCVGEVAGPPADVYQLGLLLYEMLAGEPPFVSEIVMELVRMHAFRESTPLHSRVPLVPQQLSQLVQNMLAKAPGDRPTMPQVAAKLAHFRAQRAWQPFINLPMPLPRAAKQNRPSGELRNMRSSIFAVARQRRYLFASALIVLSLYGLVKLVLLLLH